MSLGGVKRALAAMLVAPPVVGAAYVVALAVWVGTRANAYDSDVGDMRRAEAVETFVARRFGSELVRMKVGVVATAVALGIVIGLVADALIRTRRFGSAKLGALPPLRGAAWHARALAEGLALVVALHGALVLWAMADTPQLYAAGWYARGGVLRTIQVMVTDVLGPRGVVAAALSLVILYMGPRRLVAVARAGLVFARDTVNARRGVAAGAVLFGLALAGQEHVPLAPAEAKPSAAPAEHMNVLVLAADSLRADRLSPRIAPNLSRLAARSTRFDRAYVSLPRTFPSWITILTGRHAHHHGVRSMFPTWEERAKDFDALPGRFAKAGYTTGIVSDYAGDIFGRVDLGFSHVETPSFDFRQVIRQKALERETPLLPVLHSHLGRRLFPVMRELPVAADPKLLADDVESALRRSKNRPFFLTAFFSAAHFPYAAPAPYYAKYTDPKYRGRFKYHKPLSLGSEADPDEADVRQIRALYDGAVTAIDDAIGRLLHVLERLDLADRTIIVVTADHGEMLFDNGHGQGHGDHLFGDEATHVPFVVYDPRVSEGRRVASIVRDVDLAPTLYELAGIAAPSDLDGRSLAPALHGEPLAPRLAYAETELWFTEEIPGVPPALRMPYPGILGLNELDVRHNAEVVLRRDMAATTLMARHRMVRDDRFKLVYVPTRRGVRYMLFDTVADPAETTDVAAALPEEVARLRAELWAWMLQDPRMEQKDGFLVPRAAP